MSRLDFENKAVIGHLVTVLPGKLDQFRMCGVAFMGNMGGKSIGVVDHDPNKHEGDPLAACLPF